MQTQRAQIRSKNCKLPRTPALWLISVLSIFCAASALPAQNTVSTAVTGAPRLASGHPCTLWDNQDVAAYRASSSRLTPG